ncbi:MAG: hypothetical protein Q7T41_00085 [Candidatus Saccharibacteria bacterium]|nr:hypothetical protein [Candidatus Saccharibacteria bacterium]
MWQFIISGYVPGTDIQINFDILATFSMSFVLFIIFRIIIKHHLIVRREINEIIKKSENLNRISEISL